MARAISQMRDHDLAAARRESLGRSARPDGDESGGDEDDKEAE